VDSRLTLRRADIAWEFKLVEDSRVVLLIEAQSTPDEAMASRMMMQCCMVWEDHQRKKAPLPTILPVVFYTGRAKWNAADDLSQVLNSPAGLLAYAPKKCYLLLDAEQLSSSQLHEQGRMSLIVRMASAPGAAETLDVLALTKRRWGLEDREFCRDMTLWAYRVLWPTRFREADPKEVLMNLLDDFPEIAEEMRQEMRQEVREELREEERALLGRLATRKFGRRVGDNLAAHLSDLDQASDFERVSDWIVDCQSEAEILAKLPANGAAGI